MKTVTTLLVVIILFELILLEVDKCCCGIAVLPAFVCLLVGDEKKNLDERPEVGRADKDFVQG